MSISEIFASRNFLIVYSGGLICLTIAVIIRQQLSMVAEVRASREIGKIIEAAHARDAMAHLLLLAESTGARVFANSVEPGVRRAGSPPKSATARATANYLSAISVLPAARHSLEGLRPARTMIEDGYRRLHGTLHGFGDFIIRLALLGTFMGLIAALTIASANIGASQGSAAEQSAHMRDFIQVLLATAANKFWISAVGVACALIVQIYRAGAERALHIERLGNAFDDALADPEIAAAWCPPSASGEPIDLRVVRDAVLDQISKLDFRPLEEAIAETAAAIKANARHSVISFGPALSQRSGE